MLWADRYADLVRQLPAAAANARLTLCGLSTVLDAVVPLRDAHALFAPDLPQGARRLADELRRRVQLGIGGEYRADWPDGSEWLDRTLPFRLALGGTGAHAARTLALLDAPALLSLQARGASMLSVLDRNILLADSGGMVPVREVAASGADARRIYVFESTAGEAVDGIVASRSTRIIVRLHDGSLDHDPAFEQVSIGLAAQAGAGVLSGFSLLDGEALASEVARAAELARRWRENGLRLIHLELAGYTSPCYRDAVLDGLAGWIDSLGMSLSELRELVPAGESLGATLRELAERYRLSRVCVHADEWAAALTRGDPRREQQALMTGCLIAATRAACGRPVAPQGLPAGAVLRQPPDAEAGDGSHDGWHLVTCPAPWLQRPATTLGLGDTFMAGCLLVLGGKASSLNDEISGAKTRATTTREEP